MGGTSYTARTDGCEWPRARTWAGWESFGLVIATLLMAVGAGFGVSTMLMGGARIEEAAMRTAEITAKYHRLHEADFTETLFPIAEGIGGAGEAAGFSSACGVVISGIETSPAGATVKWQRSHGSCAASRMGRGEAVILPGSVPRGVGLVAVEVFTASMPSRTADRDGYAVSFAAPASGVVPVVLAGGRR